MSEYFLSGATRVWHLFVLATDDGKQPRQCR